MKTSRSVMITVQLRTKMETKRELLLPISLDTARQRLALAFTSPITLVEGNIILAKVRCSGCINNDKITAECVIYGRTIATYHMQGYLVDRQGSMWVEMTIQNDFPNLFYYPVLIWVVFWGLTHVLTGIAPVSFTSLILGIFGALIFSKMTSAVLSWHLSSAANQFEDLIRKCVSTNTLNSSKQ